MLSVPEIVFTHRRRKPRLRQQTGHAEKLRG